MVKDGKKVAIGLGIATSIGVLIYAATRVKAAPPIPPENILLSELFIEPSEVYVGEPVSISVLATNVGLTAGSYEVTCEVV